MRCSDLQLVARLGHLRLGIRSFRCENRPMSVVHPFLPLREGPR